MDYNNCSDLYNLCLIFLQSKINNCYKPLKEFIKHKDMRVFCRNQRGIRQSFYHPFIFPTIECMYYYVFYTSIYL